MSLSIITPMQFNLVKAAMATMLVNELAAQKVLLAEDGKTADQIANLYDFNVFKDRFLLPDASELPAVNIRNASGKFSQGQNFTDSKWHTYYLSIECYSVSASEPGTPADQLAAARLDYLFSQVWNTFEAESNFYKALSAIVRKAGFIEWKQLPSDDPAAAESILAIQAIYELQFEEPTQMLQGVDFEQVIHSLEIDDQFIDPYVRFIAEPEPEPEEPT